VSVGVDESVAAVDQQTELVFELTIGRKTNAHTNRHDDHYHGFQLVVVGVRRPGDVRVNTHSNGVGQNVQKLVLSSFRRVGVVD